ncbi:hypothetical protein B0J14DRAFT_643001 [Halenospora varia]|nr:hypothetical protein B0J14DRAFT_643001 [Halenospora varia]
MLQSVAKGTLGPPGSVLYRAAPQDTDLQNYTANSHSPPLQPPPYTANRPTETQRPTKSRIISPFPHHTTMADENPNQNNPQIVPLDRLDRLERVDRDHLGLACLDRLDRDRDLERQDLERRRLERQDRRDCFIFFGIFLVVIGLITYSHKSSPTPVA